MRGGFLEFLGKLRSRIKKLNCFICERTKLIENLGRICLGASNGSKTAKTYIKLLLLSQSETSVDNKNNSNVKPTVT